jgi:hypothetical protein
MLQTHTTETSYHSIKLHLMQVFQRAYRQSYPKSHGDKKQPTHQTGQEERQSQNSAHASDMTARYTAPPHRNLRRPFLHAMQPQQTHGQKPSGTVLHWLMGQSVSDTGRIGQKWWRADWVPSLLLLFHRSHRAMMNSQCTCH